MNLGKKALFARFLKIMAIVRARERGKFISSPEFHLAKKLSTSESITRRVKFVLGHCKIPTILAIYKRGLLKNQPEWTKFAAVCVKKRNSAWVDTADELLRGIFLIFPFNFSAAIRKFIFFLNRRSRRGYFSPRESGTTRGGTGKRCRYV